MSLRLGLALVVLGLGSLDGTPHAKGDLVTNQTLVAFVGRAPSSEGFIAHLDHIDQSEMPPEVLATGGPWASLEDALGWARARAPQLVLTYGYSEADVFSAGAEPYAGETLPAWPPPDAQRASIDAAVQRIEAAPPSSKGQDQLGVLEPEWLYDNGSEGA
jgi:hypothetical protein